MKELSKRRYGKLTIIGEPFRGFANNTSKQASTYVKVICECGNTKQVVLMSLIHGNTKSCGCLHKQKMADYCKRMFSKYGNEKYHPLYKLWHGIKNRVTVKYGNNYKNYVIRNITLCEEWKNDYLAFYNWAMTNGWKKGLQIDRIDNDGNYEPSNCRFVTNAINMRNRRNNKLTTEQVIQIRELSKKYLAKDIAPIYKISDGHCRDIINLKCWLL